MSWIIGISLVLAGVVIGFFVSRQFPVILEDNKLKEELQKVKLQAQDYQTDVDNYINDVQYNLNKLDSQLDDVKQKLATPPRRNSEALDNLTGTAPFFDHQALAHLRATKYKNHKESEAPQSPPLDYANQSSGLFVGKENESASQVSKEENA